MPPPATPALRKGSPAAKLSEGRLFLAVEVSLPTTESIRLTRSSCTAPVAVSSTRHMLPTSSESSHICAGTRASTERSPSKLCSSVVKAACSASCASAARSVSTLPSMSGTMSSNICAVTSRLVRSLLMMSRVSAITSTEP